jgi:hypothetical protein
MTTTSVEHRAVLLPPGTKAPSFPRSPTGPISNDWYSSRGGQSQPAWLSFTGSFLMRMPTMALRFGAIRDLYRRITRDATHIVGHPY